MEQLKSDFASIEITLSGDVLEKIDEIHKARPNPIS